MYIVFAFKLSTNIFKKNQRSRECRKYEKYISKDLVKDKKISKNIQMLNKYQIVLKHATFIII